MRCSVHRARAGRTSDERERGTSHYYVSIRPENSRGLAIRGLATRGRNRRDSRAQARRRKASIESVKKGRGEIKRVDEMEWRRKPKRKRRRRTKEVLKKVVGTGRRTGKKRGDELD